MVAFLNATQSRGEIERILTKAKFDIVVISPYIKIRDDLISRLIDSGSRNIRIMLICREEDLQPAERSKLEHTPNLTLRFNERVHAKCFYNENTMVITSLNLYSSSLGDNREMGVLLQHDLEGDKAAFEDAKSEAQFIIRESAPNQTKNIAYLIKDEIRSPKKSYEVKPKAEIKPKKETTFEDSIVKGISEFFGVSGGDSKKGYCIRCSEKIAFKLDAPYCSDCYKTWARYKDNTYKEKTCHKCGKTSETSMKYPVCSSCNKYSK